MLSSGQTTEATVVFAAYCSHVKQVLKRDCLAARRAFLFHPFSDTD
jgi:hypothetical protein